MSYGMAVYDGSGTKIWDTTGILARVVGIATISFGTREYTTKSVTIPNLISTDRISVMVGDNNAVAFSVSRSGTTVSITRTASYLGNPSTHYIWAFRTQ